MSDFPSWIILDHIMKKLAMTSGLYLASMQCHVFLVSMSQWFFSSFFFWVSWAMSMYEFWSMDDVKNLILSMPDWWNEFVSFESNCLNDLVAEKREVGLIWKCLQCSFKLNPSLAKVKRKKNRRNKMQKLHFFVCRIIFGSSFRREMHMLC